VTGIWLGRIPGIGRAIRFTSAPIPETVPFSAGNRWDMSKTPAFSPAPVDPFVIDAPAALALLIRSQSGSGMALLHTD